MSFIGCACCRMFTGSRRVLATKMDDGQESLLVLAPSTSLRPWVQKGLGVTVDSRAYLHLGETMPHCSFDVLFIAFGSIKDSSVTSYLERFSLKPEKARGRNLPSAL